MAKKFVGYLSVSPSNVLSMLTTDITTGKSISGKCYEIPNINQFISDKIDDVQQNYKAVILNVFYYDGDRNYPINEKFCKHLAYEFGWRKIPYYFISNHALHITATLIAASFKPKINQKIIVVLVEQYGLFKFELCRHENGWQISDYSDETSMKPINFKKFCDKFCQENTDNKPKFASNLTSNEDSEMAINVLQNFYQFTIFKDFFQKQTAKVLSQMAKHVCDASFNQFHFFQGYIRKLMVSRKMYVGGLDDVFFPRKAPSKISVPFYEEYIVPRKHNYFYIYVLIGEEYTVMEGEKALEDRCHQIKLKFLIDENQNPSFKQTPIIVKSIKTFPQTLNQKIADFKFPVIGFLDNLSFVCIWDEKIQSYKFMDSWNGLYGKNLFLSFAKENPEIVEKALDIKEKRGSNIVFDLIKIMSMNPEKICCDSEWGFEVTKDLENPVLLKFDTFDKKGKTKSPISLMAVLLNEHLKAIQKETGQIRKELGFCIFDKFDSISQKRLEKQLHVVCEAEDIKCHVISIDTD